ncbi:MAG: DUF58 domain-containing protein [Acidimicrobiales bacterium]
MRSVGVSAFGAFTALIGAAVSCIGILCRWEPVTVLGVGLVLLDAGSLSYVMRRPRVSLSRSIEPHYVEKGGPAVALIEATNQSRRAVGALVVEQNIGGQRLVSSLPRLAAGQSAIRAYRLPTDSRGTFRVGPIDLPRSDPFGMWRSVQILGSTDVFRVRPRIVKLAPLAVGASRIVEGPSSDAAPQGSITFHRLREYVIGDELRLVHWPSSAHLGRLVVRQNVDTAQARTVVVLDVNPSSYSVDGFEQAVDVAASVVVSMSVGLGPVELRSTSGEIRGTASFEDVEAIDDYLTDVTPESSGSVLEQLLLLRRAKGGTSLVVVAGGISGEVLATLSALRRRFDRIVVVSIVEEPMNYGAHPGVTVLQCRDANELSRRWRTGADL